jgi:hypothetical protein
MSCVVPFRCRAVPSVCHCKTRCDTSARCDRGWLWRLSARNIRWDRLGGRSGVARYVYRENRNPLRTCFRPSGASPHQIRQNPRRAEFFALSVFRSIFVDFVIFLCRSIFCLVAQDPDLFLAILGSRTAKIRVLGFNDEAAALDQVAHFVAEGPTHLELSRGLQSELTRTGCPELAGGPANN